MICLDTNAVIAAILLRPLQVRHRLEAELQRAADIAVSTIVLYELRYGIAKSVRPEANANALGAFLALGIAELPFNSEDAREAGGIRALLERTGTPIGPYDLLIAAQARRHNATLVTANTREFVRVPGLKTVDWASE